MTNLFSKNNKKFKKTFNFTKNMYFSKHNDLCCQLVCTFNNKKQELIYYFNYNLDQRLYILLK